MLAEQKIAIVGAGLMGHGLAQVFAEAGATVAVHDPVPEALASVTERVAHNLEELERPLGALAQITTHAELGEAVRGSAFIIEAAPEDLALKRSIFEQLERFATPEAILATNTSVIPVGEIASNTSRPERVVGTHWWNPPYLIPLVEVVQGPRTAAQTVLRTSELLAAAGKAPVHVKRDVPGFVGNRLQHALWREAIALVADGVCDAPTVDLVVKNSFGLRLSVLGPLENADLVGLDLTLAIHEQVLPHIDSTPGPSPYLRELVAAGKLGMKSGEGFQQWNPGQREQISAQLSNHLRKFTTTPGNDFVGAAQNEERQ